MKRQEKQAKIAFLFYKSTKFVRILRALRNRYVAENQPAYLVVPYVLTCAMALESKLNDALVEHVRKRWGDAPVGLADAYLSMNLRGKLNAIVPVLTDNRYRINRDHFVYQRLASLITIRNQIAHAKSKSEEMEVPLVLHPIGPPLFPPHVPVVPPEKAEDVTMGATEAFSPLEYHEALEKLEKWFFMRCPDKLRKVALVMPQEGCRTPHSTRTGPKRRAG